MFACAALVGYFTYLLTQAIGLINVNAQGTEAAQLIMYFISIFGAVFGGYLSDNAEKRSRISVLKTYLRAGFSDTPWLSPGQTKLRPAKAELKMQLMYDF